jgi:hypothetical protein
MQELKTGATYRHYKDKLYKVLGTVRHSESLEELVLYEALYPNSLGSLWVRPKAMFLDEVSTPTYQGPRFRLERTTDES